MAHLRDLLSNLKRLQLLNPNAHTSDQQSSSLNLADGRNAYFAALVGASLDTLSGSVYIELAIEHSDDNSSWSAAADTDISGTALSGAQTATFAVIDDPAEDDQLYDVEYQGDKQYARCIVNLVGTHTNGTPIGILGVQDLVKKP